LQQVASSQPRPEWAEKQSPAPGQKALPQVVRANWTQRQSHSFSQQDPSSLQTAAQQVLLPQLGPSCGKKQFPSPAQPHSSWAWFTQMVSQALLQQSESKAQTFLQQASFSQPGVG
jgi:hypothetical protein